MPLSLVFALPLKMLRIYLPPYSGKRNSIKFQKLCVTPDNPRALPAANLAKIIEVYFENGGEDVVSSTGETLVYTSKSGYTYDFDKIRPCIDDIAGISKAVKLNTGLIDRMISGKSLENDVKEKLKEARTGYSENRIVNVIKPQNNIAVKERYRFFSFGDAMLIF